MKEYDALFIIDPEKEGSIDEIVGNIKNGLSKANAKLNKEENWGKQKLSYPIKKKQEGIYYKVDFSADPSEIAALKSNYGLNVNILRAAITLK